MVVSYVGYQTQRVLVGDRTNITVTLQLDQKLLDDVVVVGYGVQTHSDLTGSISSISADEIKKQPVASLDGASRFGETFCHGFFPSGSVAWRMTNDDFMQDQNLFSELKPRISYGITGNQEGIGNFASRGLFGVSDYRATPILVPAQLSNANLSWESTRQFDVGLNVGLLNDRITLSADYFIKTTDDLLLNRLVPGVSGFSSVTDNIGKMENKGFEFSVRGAVLSGRDLSWSYGFNISFIENTALELEVDDQVLNDSRILSEGQSIGTFYLIDHNGVDPQTGNMHCFDENGDGVIDSGDRRIVGDAFDDADDVITNGGYVLLDDVAVVFSTTDVTSESIFDLVFTDQDRSSLFTFMFQRDEYNVDPDLISLFEAGDARADLFRFERSSERSLKWSNPNNANNVKVIRLAEMYLIRSEAAVFDSNDPNAGSDDLNEIRNRAGLNDVGSFATREEYIDALLYERHAELNYEGHRFFDLVRLDRFDDVLNRVAFRRAFLIPRDELQISVNLVQNPEYPVE